MQWRAVQQHAVLMAVFLISLGLRLIFVYQWRSLPYSLAPFMDAKAFDDWAQAIANGQWLSASAFYQSPLYPYFLALVFKLAGHSLLLVSTLQAFLGALSCVLIAAISKRHFGEGAAWVAGLLMAFDRVLIFYVAPAMKETLMVLCLGVTVGFALACLSDGRRRSAVGFGVFLGLTALLRGNILAISVVFAGLAFRQLKARALWPVTLAAAASLTMILPATLHNWWVSDDLVWMNSCGGFTFYVGNSPSATGANSYPPFVSSDIAQEEKDTRRIAEERVGHKLKPSEVSRYWFQEGLGYLRSHPQRELWLIAHKIWYFWNEREIPDNYDSDFIRRHEATLLSGPLVNFTAISLLAITGLALQFTTSIAARALAGFSLIYFLTVLPFLVSDRYRLPELIFLLPAAGAALAPLLATWRQRKWRSLLPVGLILLPFAALAFTPTDASNDSADAFNWGLQASLYSEAKQDEEALRALDRALRISPSFVNSDVYVKASTSAERLGRLGQAEALLQSATEIHPADGLTFYNLARFNFEHGQPERAVALYGQALKVMPHLYQPYIGLGVLFYQRGDRMRARAAVEEGLKLNPESAQLQQLRQIIEAP